METELYDVTEILFGQQKLILCRIGNFRSIEDHFLFEYDKAT